MMASKRSQSILWIVTQMQNLNQRFTRGLYDKEVSIYNVIQRMIYKVHSRFD